MVDEKVIRLLCDSFGDSEKYVKSLIASGFLDGNGLFAEYSDGKPVSVLFVKQFPSNVGDEQCFADYIYYVATDKKYRGKGIASELIRKTVKKLSNGDGRFAALIPASEKLFDFYSKLGFLPDLYVSRHIYTENDFSENQSEIYETDSSKSNSLYGIYEKKYKNMSDCIYKSETVFYQICDEFSYCDDEKILFDGKNLAFAIIGDGVMLREFTGNDERTFALSVGKKYGFPVVVETIPENEKIPIGMIYWYKNRPDRIAPIYIDNILN